MPLPALHLQFVQASVKTVTAPELSFRGAKRRGNLVQAVTISPGSPCYSTGYCEIAPQGHFLALRAQGATSACGLLAMTNRGGYYRFIVNLFGSAVQRRERHAAPLQGACGRRP